MHLAPFFGRWNAASVSDDHVRDFIVRRQAAEASNAEINRELAILRRGYSLASKTVTVRPDIPKLKEAAPREGFFEVEQFEAVCRHLPPYLLAPFRFAYLTGWGRVFPFNDALAAILTAQREHTDAVQRERNMVVPWVFHRSGMRIKDFYGAWDTACAKAGCPSRIAHDFRRTAVRNLVRAGVPEGVAMKLTGHKTRAVFERYNITSGADLRDAVRRLDLAVGKVSGKVAPIRARKAAAGA